MFQLVSLSTGLEKKFCLLVVSVYSLKSFSGKSFTSSVEASVTEDKGQEFFMTLMTEHLGNIFITCESEMNGIIWIFTIWFHCDKLVLKPANQVCSGTHIRCALGHSTAIENTSDPKRAVTLLCSPPALSQWPVQFELSVLFIRCIHNCHLHCDECYTLDLTSCVSWGFRWNLFFAFGQW